MNSIIDSMDAPLVFKIYSQLAIDMRGKLEQAGLLPNVQSNRYKKSQFSQSAMEHLQAMSHENVPELHDCLALSLVVKQLLYKCILKQSAPKAPNADQTYATIEHMTRF